MNHDGQNISNPQDMHEKIEQRLISDIFCPFSEQGMEQTEVDSSPLVDKQLDLQGQFDRQLIIRTLQQKQPNLQSIQLYANKQLDLNHYDNHPQFDRQFPFQLLHEKQPQLTNTSIRPHPKLQDSQLGKQQEYDKQALVADIDRNQPDIILIKRREDEKIEVARLKAVDNDLKIGEKQESIKIKSVEDVYVESRVYQNQGVHPLENKHDFEEESTVAQFQIPINNRERVNKSSLNNQLQVQEKLLNKQRQNYKYNDQDWHINIHPTIFSKQKLTNKDSILNKFDKDIEIVHQPRANNSGFNVFQSNICSNDEQRKKYIFNPLIDYAKRIHLQRKSNNFNYH